LEHWIFAYGVVWGKKGTETHHKTSQIDGEEKAFMFGMRRT
jgi:hypothetical protein